MKPDKALSGTEGWSRRESVEPNTRQAAGQRTALTTCTSRGTTAGGGGEAMAARMLMGEFQTVIRGSVVSGLHPLNAKVNTRRDALRHGYLPHRSALSWYPIVIPV
ncbi:unnamed protein product [Arctogadus glacialis]